MHLPGYGSLMPEFKKLSGSLVDTLDIRSQRIPSSRKLKEYSSLILVGDFADNSDTSPKTKLHLELIESWTSLSIQKSWLLLNDLHFGVEKLLLGKNNSVSEKLNSQKSIVNDLCSSIDKLFWRHEQNFCIHRYAHHWRRRRTSQPRAVREKHHNRVASPFP